MNTIYASQKRESLNLVLQSIQNIQETSQKIDFS